MTRKYQHSLRVLAQGVRCSLNHQAIFEEKEVKTKMGISVMTLLPQSETKLAQADVAPAAQVGGDGSSAAKRNSFEGLLASISTRAAARPRPARQDGAQSRPLTAAKDRLQRVLSSLSGGNVDLASPGLGLTQAQQQQLLANLQKLLQGGGQDGPELLASLLAASQMAGTIQLAGTIQPKDLAALTQLLGTTVQGTVSIDALSSNLHLLAQAVQLVAGSDGKMTLVQAVQELTSSGDAFAQQLAAAIAQPADAQTASEAPIPSDTGPPKGESPAGGAVTTASATAGSNGRESTVTPTGATSPADGAAQAATSDSKTASPEVPALAKAIEDLFRAMSPDTSDSGKPDANGTAATLSDGTSGQPTAVPVGPATVTTFAAALEMSGTPVAEAPVRPAVEQVVVDHIVQNATLALRNGEQEFRIQLKPDFLGVMEVRVSMDNGVVAVRMSVESAATRQLIDNNIGQLRQAFGTGEVRVEHVPNFSSDAPWTFSQGDQQGFWQGQSPSGSPLPEAIPFSGDAEQSAEAAASAAASTASTQYSAMTPDGGIDIQA